MEKLKITIYPHEVKRKELVNACRMIVDQTRKEAGCMDSRLVMGEKDENSIILEQHWRQRDLFKDYLRSEHFTALLGAMKLLAANFEFIINDGPSSEGALFVDRSRNRK